MYNRLKNFKNEFIEIHLCTGRDLLAFKGRLIEINRKYLVIEEFSSLGKYKGETTIDLEYVSSFKVKSLELDVLKTEVNFKKAEENQKATSESEKESQDCLENN